MTKENKIELEFIEKLKDLKYVYRDDIRTKESLNQNFRKNFEELNYVNLSDAEFARLLDRLSLHIGTKRDSHLRYSLT